MKNIKPRLNGKNIAIVVATGVYEQEFWVPYYQLKEENANVMVAGIEKGKIYRGEGPDGKNGPDFCATDKSIQELNADELDGIIVPGGIYGPMALRVHKPLLKLIQELNTQEKLIASICHGPWVLISAGILKGKKATCPDDMADDLKNAGADFVDTDVVQDGNIITAEYYGFLPKFMEKVIASLE